MTTMKHCDLRNQYSKETERMVDFLTSRDVIYDYLTGPSVVTSVSQRQLRN